MLSGYTMYSSGYCMEKYPLVGKMLVPVEKLAEKKGKAATAGNILNKYYTDIVSAIAANERKEE